MKINISQTLLAFLMVTGSLAQGQNSSATLPNMVETVKLSTPIPSTGRLGGISVDKLGIMYVADFRDKVWKIDPSGEATLFAEGLYGTSGSTIDPKGNLIQSNYFANSIVRIDRNGHASLISDKNLNGPVGVVSDDSGNLFVCNCAGNTISKIDSEGITETFATSDLFNCPNGITFGPLGDLYVANYHNDIIVKISPEGIATEFTTVKGGQGNAHITYAKENFYVTKIKSNVIFRVTPSGESFLTAGSFNVSGYKDGDAIQALFTQPNGIAQDPYGSDLYVTTLNGEWVVNRIGEPTTIDIRKIDIKTVTEIFDEVLEKQGLEAAVKAYRSYKNDPTHKHEDTGVETGTYAWQLMVEKKVTEAIQVFALLSESYPERWRPYYYLGQVHTIIGKTDKAIEFYKTSLKKLPNNPLVETKLNALLGK